jgi:hypothetical protein
MNPSTDDPNFYINGAKKMVSEGMEVVSKIMAYIKTNEDTLKDMQPAERKKRILDFEPAKMFNQVHPIVFQYLAVEGIFNANAFRRYVISVYGKPKSEEDMAKIREDTKYMYHYKNAQYALYYKYLLIETNPQMNKNTLHAMYEEVVNALNKDTDKMLDAYAKAQEESKIEEEKFSNEKRKELLELLKKRI